jgi:Na+/melibiose symporter-like transporter
MFLMGVPYAAGLFLLRAMMADVGDEVRLNGGVDRTGLLFALLQGTVKLASAVSVALAFVLLEAAGFVADDPASREGELVLLLLFAGVPALLSFVSAGLLLGFPLTAQRHAEIRRQLDALAPSKPQNDVHALSAAK